MSAHVTVQELSRILALGAEAPRRFEVVDHLARSCPRCLEALRRLARSPELEIRRDEDSPNRDELVSLVLERLLTLARQGAEDPETPSPTYRDVVAQTFRSPLGFCRLILEESRLRGRREPEKAVALAQQALCLVGRFKLGEGRRRALADLRARGHAYLGDALRLACSHLEAEQALAVAAGELREGSGDRELEATVLEIRATLARDQNDYSQARERFEKAVSLLAGSEDLAIRRAEVLIAKADVDSELGDSARALEDLREALARLPPDEYPRLRLRALHNLAADAVRSGRLVPAVDHFREAAGLYDEHGDVTLLAQRDWLLGTVYMKDRQWRAAEHQLKAALDAYLGLDRGLDAVRILIDLAGVYLAQCDERKVRWALRRLTDLSHHDEARALMVDRLRQLHEAASGEARTDLAVAIRRLATGDDGLARAGRPN